MVGIVKGKHSSSREPERAKLAAKPPIFASAYKIGRIQYAHQSKEGIRYPLARASVDLKNEVVAPYWRSL